MGEWIIENIVKAVLGWLASLIGHEIVKMKDKSADEKANAEIKDAVEGAKDEKSAQDGLDRAASRLGRRD